MTKGEEADLLHGADAAGVDVADETETRASSAVASAGILVRGSRKSTPPPTFFAPASALASKGSGGGGGGGTQLVVTTPPTVDATGTWVGTTDGPDVTHTYTYTLNQTAAGIVSGVGTIVTPFTTVTELVAGTVNGDTLMLYAGTRLRLVHAQPPLPRHHFFQRHASRRLLPVRRRLAADTVQAVAFVD